MTNEDAIETLSVELWHTESHMRIEGKASEYYEELSQIAEALKMAIKALKNERQKGEWITTDNSLFHWWRCSVCGHEIQCHKTPNCCENCGARMEADNDKAN